MIKKSVLGLFVAMLFLFGVSQVAAGPDIGIGPNASEDIAGGIAKQGGYDTNVNQYTLSRTIGRYIRGGLGLMGTIFFVLTIYAGYLWMTAQGNSEQVEKAQGILKTAVIGMIIVFAAFGITWMVLLITTLSSTPNGSEANMIKTINNMIF